jgi:hypothetical protein
MQIEITGKLAEAVSQKFNLSLPHYFPRFHKELQSLGTFREKVDKFMS